jgi:hypothetical protein
LRICAFATNVLIAVITAHPASTMKFCADAQAAIVRRQEQDHAREVLRSRRPGRPGSRPSPPALRREPQGALPIGHDPPWNDGVHADVGRTEIARQPARKTTDGGLGCGVGRHPAGAGHPADGAEVDVEPPPRRFICSATACAARTGGAS